MTFSSVTLGALIAALVGRFDPLLYALTLVGMIAFHAAANLINDFYDVRHGVDKPGAPTTKYRPHPSAFGQESPYLIRRWAVVFFVAAVTIGAYIAVLRSPWILLLIFAGVTASVFYTADPIVLKAKGLGEVIVFAMWGLLIPLGSYEAETGSSSSLPVLAAIPLGIFVALVLLANNIRDIEYDSSMGALTVAARLGKNLGVKLYSGLLLVAYIFVPTLIALGVLPLWSLLTLATVPQAVGLWRMFRGEIPDAADPRTAGVALVFSVLYMASFILQIVVPL